MEELLSLRPAQGGRDIVVDLEASLQRSGLVAFIKEWQQSQCALLFSKDGLLEIPAPLQNLFEFYTEFYGLSRAMLKEVEILKAAAEEKKESKGGAQGEDSLKKLDAPAPKEKEKKKPKVSVKLEPRNVNTVPAGIVQIVGNPAAQGMTAPKPLTPAPLSNRLGAQRISLNRYALATPASSIKSVGFIGRR